VPSLAWSSYMSWERGDYIPVWVEVWHSTLRGGRWLASTVGCPFCLPRRSIASSRARWSLGGFYISGLRAIGVGGVLLALVWGRGEGIGSLEAGKVLSRLGSPFYTRSIFIRPSLVFLLHTRVP
jgi:hypothetical protein